MGAHVFAGCAALEDLKAPERFHHLSDDLFINSEMDDTMGTD
jgi:hypothetical protein